MTDVLRDVRDVRDAPGWRQEENVRCLLSVSRLFLAVKTVKVSFKGSESGRVSGFSPVMMK